MNTVDTIAASAYRAAPAILAAALALMLGSPAFASSEAPVEGGITVMTNPAFTTAGAEGPAVFLPAPSGRVIVGGGTQVSSGSEGYVGPKV
ncbi:hypothetical protein [Elioraea sp.]|uniref:hypothetical protein n=1 Tax=Elioraea sp. TaxID=2185103 RepID=UPI0025BBC603|nr:hypothetical protein [Elioraea sp.]